MRRALLVLVWLLLWLVSAGAAEPGGTIRVGGDYDFAPFEYLDEQGTPAGFDLDVLRAVAEVMGLEIELRLGPWEQVRQDLEQGRIDLLAGMRYSEERALTVDFSAPYLINTSAIFVRQGSSIRSLEDLKGKEIIVQHGDIMDDQVRTMNLAANIVLVKNQTEALNLLAQGKHDAALCSRLRGRYLIRQLGLDHLTSVGPALAGGPYGFALAKGNPDLLAQLNEGLRILKAGGRYDAIYRRWFGLDQQRSLAKDLLHYARWVLTPLLLLLALAAAWVWTLHRQVARKTRELEAQLLERQRTEARLEAEKTFRQLVEASPVPMAIISAEQRMLYVNHKFSDLFGYTLEQLPDTQTWWSLACSDPTRTEGVLTAWHDRFGQEGQGAAQGAPFEVEVRCADGSLRHVTCQHAASDGRHFIVFNDLTQRKRAEQALAFRSRLESLVSAISTRFVNLADEVDAEIDRALQEIGGAIGVDRSYVFRFSADGRTLRNSHEWCADGIAPQIDRLQDLPADDFAWSLQQLRDQGLFYCPSVSSLGPEAETERQEWLREGIQSLITVPLLLKGAMVGFIGFDSVRSERHWREEIPILLRIVGESFANALERCRVEEQLRLAHRQLQDIIDFLPDATLVIDREGRVVAWNRAVEEMTGIPKEQMLGRGDHAYTLPFHGECRPALIDRALELGHLDPAGSGGAERQGHTLVSELYLPGINRGRGGYVWAKAAALFDREGNLTGAIESLRDISERKRAQQQLETSHREMEAFVATVSHDLRMPLTPIIGYADYLVEQYRDRLDPQGLDCLAEISASGAKMLKLMEDLLALARVGQLAPPADPVDPKGAVDQVLGNLAAQIAATGVRLQVGKLPPLRLPETLLYQLFANLIGNALQYAGKAGDPIEIGGERRGDQVEFFVRDHGPGIPEAEGERIFEAFYRGPEEKSGTGTGIGLATVQKIARLHGGRAWVEETAGGGATFWVRVRDAGTIG